MVHKLWVEKIAHRLEAVKKYDPYEDIYYSIVLTSMDRYCMSTESFSILYGKLQHKLGQDFLERQ